MEIAGRCMRAPPWSAANTMRSRSVHLRRTTGALLRTGDIGLEGVLPLAIRDLLDAFPGHLIGRVVDLDVELADLGDRALVPATDN